MDLQEATRLAMLGQLMTESRHKRLHGYDFIKDVPQLKHLSPLYHKYNELNSRSNFYTYRSSGEYEDGGLKQQLEDVEEELFNSCMEALDNDTTFVVKFNNSEDQLIMGKTKEQMEELINDYNSSLSDYEIDNGKGVFRYFTFRDWFDNYDYPDIGRSRSYIKV